MSSIFSAYVRTTTHYLLAAIAAGCLLAPPTAPAQQQQQQQSRSTRPAPSSAGQATSAKQLLSAAVYAYNHDDISPKTEQQFRALLTPKYQGTQEAESARYFLASFYQRKFYIQRKKSGKDDWESLKAARQEFKNYTDAYYRPNAKWLADSFFNLALVNWQLGDKGGAYNELQKMAAAARNDGSVYIYEVIWSQSSQDVVDAYLPTQNLAAYTLSLLSGNARQYNQSKIANDSNQSFEQAVRSIRQWCQGQH